MVMPVARRWADKISSQVKDHVIQLIPWRSFHIIQRLFLYFTFFLTKHFAGVANRPITLVSFFFMTFSWIWAVALAFYITKTWLHQRLGESTDESKDNQIVSGVTHDPFGSYPSKSVLVRGDTSKRFEELVEPTKLHQQLMEKEKEEDKERQRQEEWKKDEEQAMIFTEAVQEEEGKEEKQEEEGKEEKQEEKGMEKEGKEEVVKEEEEEVKEEEEEVKEEEEEKMMAEHSQVGMREGQVGETMEGGHLESSTPKEGESREELDSSQCEGTEHQEATAVESPPPFEQESAEEHQDQAGESQIMEPEESTTSSTHDDSLHS